jgi:hypothetical protein
MSPRDNGLPATSYTRLVDVETHLVEGLLDRLRDEQVAAYVAPAAGARGPYGDIVLPASPSDSVYVDSNRREHAQAVIDRYLAEVADELAWAAIVADFDAPSADPVRRWPAAEDVDPSPETTDSSPSTVTEPWPEEGGAVGGARVVRPAERDAVAPDAAVPDAAAPDAVAPESKAPAARPRGDEDHFEPPPPPPIPLPDTIGRFAWAAVLGGPLFLIVATVFDLEGSGWPAFLALGAFVGGFVTLVARMKDRPPTDLGDDDGAVV